MPSVALRCSSGAAAVAEAEKAAEPILSDTKTNATPKDLNSDRTCVLTGRTTGSTMRTSSRSLRTDDGMWKRSVAF